MNLNLDALTQWLFGGIIATIGVVLFWAGVLDVPGVSRGGEKDGVSAVVESYYSAYADGDAAAVCASTSTTSMAQYTRGTAGCEAVVQQQIIPSVPEATRASFAKVHVHEVIVDGRLASAVVSFDGGDRGPVYLERLNERWLMRSLHPLRAP
jgi:hypothetical protein